MRTFFLSCLLALTSEPFFYSQYRQDELIYTNFFQGKEDGVFVDIGAHDGITISNTLFFEQKGWKGICIEPLPEVFEKLKKNRTAICVNGCIAEKVGVAEFTQVSGYAETLSGLTSKYDPKHQRRIDEEIRAYGGEKKTIQVMCFTLNELLAEHQFSHVDYLSLDTEGGEFEILKSIDFEKYDIETISVENNYKDPRFKKFLYSKGYALIARKGCDEIYKKPTLTPTKHLSFYFIRQFLPENPVIVKIDMDYFEHNRLCHLWRKGQIYLIEEDASMRARLKKEYIKKKNVHVLPSLEPLNLPRALAMQIPAVIDLLYLQGECCNRMMTDPTLQAARMVQLKDYPEEIPIWLQDHGFVSLFQSQDEALFVRK